MADREKLFKSFPALANLADQSDGGITIEVVGNRGAGYDEPWLRNAVFEPLDESGTEGLSQ